MWRSPNWWPSGAGCVFTGVSEDQTMFLGSVESSLDAKRRVQVPSSWRNACGSPKFALVKWQPDPSEKPCILGMMPSLLFDFVKKMNDKPFSDPKAERVRRSLSREAALLELDSAGRLTLPVNLMNVTGLAPKSKIMVVGMFDRFQIWNLDDYLGVSEEDDKAYPDAIKEF